MKLDRNLPYATIVGHDTARYEQGGMLFGPDEISLAPPASARTPVEDIIHHDGVENAKQFLLTVLKGKPVSKSALFKAAQDTNLEWENVRQASLLLGIIAFTYRNSTMWKLPETADV